MFIKKIVVILICVHLPSLSFAQTQKINLQDVVLPKDIGVIPPKSGNIFYSPTDKTKALIPVNMWGEITASGLHYIPTNTSLVKGLSLAGGPRGTANLSDVRVTRKLTDGTLKIYEFDMDRGGELSSHDFALQPGDAIFIPQNRFEANRAYYTSLIGVVATILTSILLYRKVSE